MLRARNIAIAVLSALVFFAALTALREFTLGLVLGVVVNTLVQLVILVLAVFVGVRVYRHIQDSAAGPEGADRMVRTRECGRTQH